ncbi:MAG: hypothetical protein ACRYG7_08605 [Janthinobacterium lividum]
MRDKKQARFTQDAFGQEVERQMGVVHLQWQYDALGRPVHQRGWASPGSNHCRERRYRWQGSEQLTEIDDSLAGLTQYAYEAWGNSAAAQYATGTHKLRQPATVGNLFRTPARTNRRYGAGGQLAADGTRYRYDTEGNLLPKTLPNGAVWHYDWPWLKVWYKG